MDVERGVKFNVLPLIRQTCFCVTSLAVFRYASKLGENVRFVEYSYIKKRIKEKLMTKSHIIVQGYEQVYYKLHCLTCNISM